MKLNDINRVTMNEKKLKKALDYLWLAGFNTDAGRIIAVHMLADIYTYMHLQQGMPFNLIEKDAVSVFSKVLSTVGLRSLEVREAKEVKESIKVAP